MGHEVGHALFTPNENWKLKYPELPHNFVNILEDVRVERLIKRRFAGIHKTFFHGYAKLADDDFFGISETDIEDLTLADRLNLFFKIGNFEDIPFSGKEQYFVDRATQLETFSDVLELSRELWQHCKDSVESPNDLPPQQKVKHNREIILPNSLRTFNLNLNRVNHKILEKMVEILQILVTGMNWMN